MVFKMRLSKIKLAGFKSFVDPTVLELKSPLVAVVGPNGCGKSNVIDAVRWVMGESSAKNLRGESMSDVIFNGSSGRKPVGQASIELVFDNSDGSLGGEYANFAEISIRRQASRDNQSNYFLNGTRCRRRDITDIFLGTGLGPRSYSIIEQGMISRVIEAKPEDLRAFLEEAAGISLYRRRRQETETRMRHTRENLARLDDVRQELEKQLDRLKRQSESALRYQQFKETQETLEAELASLRWHLLKEQMESKSTLIRGFNNGFEEKMAGKTNIDLELEKLREQHAEKTEEYNEVHTQYYEVATQIARNEQSLEHHRERQQQLQNDLEQSQYNIEKIYLQLEQDKARLEALLEEWEGVVPDFETAKARVEEYGRILEEAQNAMRHFQEGFEQFQEQSGKMQQTAEVEKARIEQLDKHSREANAQLSRLQHELASLDWETLDQSLTGLVEEIAEREQTTRSHVQTLASLSEQLKEVRLERDTIIKTLDNVSMKRQSEHGRLASLEALQQAALGKTDGTVKEWLRVAGCAENQRIGECIKVESGFERALETVLGSALEAVCVNSIDEIAATLTQFSEGNVTFFESKNQSAQSAQSVPSAQNVPHNTSINATLLSQKVKSDLILESFLTQVYVVDDLNDALKIRTKLNKEESVVTRDGIWLSRDWLRVYRDTSGHSGVLERENEILRLKESLFELNQSLEDLESQKQDNQSKNRALEDQRELIQSTEAKEAQILKELTGKSAGLRARLEHTRNRVSRVQEEIEEQNQRLSLSQEEASLARLSLQSALDAMEDFTLRREGLHEERAGLKQLLNQAEQNLSQAKDLMHGLALKRENLKAQLEAIRQGITRLEEQHSALLTRRSDLELALQDNNEPFLELREKLETLLAERIQSEHQLNLARSKVEAIDSELQSHEKRRLSLEQEAEVIRRQLDEARLALQALEIHSQTVQEKLVTVGRTAEEIWQTLPPEAEENVWSERLEEVTQKIQRLGAINLAAIEEFQSENERKNYLDAQHSDLTEALETLENAIRKIDRETRARFKETFDKVNTDFQTLYPRLFGGGQAYLELVGDDLLEAGVTVMARPPGKRNSSIHLLSGGEKALTAVALVFAIFQLNPAPFCMLDEVDAPLDDANVGRFCELVKHMSSSVQFIYITHNKVSMEMAHHLVGVTMKEPGVSRLVSVDVAEAFAMATS